MHVVREDPEQEGLLYAGTLQGAYVSFDQGKHWQTLQQNLPATPVTDFKVHHGDLVASTMGRAFWILDNVSPLRQIAASVTKPTRQRTTDDADGPDGLVGAGADAGVAPAIDVALASMQTGGRGSSVKPRSAGLAGDDAAAPAAARATIKPFDGSNVFLFTPAPAYRMHYTPLDRPSRSAGVSGGRRADRLLPREPVR